MPQTPAPVAEPVPGSADLRPAHAAVVAGDVIFGSFSLPRRRGERLACGSDEDAVTLAVDAAERALAAWQRDRAEIDAVHVVLGHGPEILGTLAHAVREALGL